MTPLIAIVGRPNVGKSTLFNRLVGLRRALVDPAAGVTRDRIYGEFEHGGRTFGVIDTGGLELNDKENIVSGIRAQAEAALQEADLIALVVDVRAGLTAADEEIAAFLRRHDKPLLLVINKVDSNNQVSLAHEFARLGFNHSVMTSAEHGGGIGELLNQVAESVPGNAAHDGSAADPGLRVAIIGRPNVGKSSILNALIGRDRVMVSEQAGTTRDLIDERVELDGQAFTFVDTAGIRKKSAITARMEAVSSIKARRSIARSDCVILVLNGEEGVTAQDKALAGIIDQDSSGAIIAFNKWDIVKERIGSGEEGDQIIKEVRRDLKSLTYAPIVSTCALSGQRTPKLLEMLTRVAEARERTISTADLTQFIEEMQARTPVPSPGPKQAQIMRMAQVSSAPARFRLFVRGFIPENYLKFIERELRNTWNFEGTPIHFIIVRV